jgi:hypothetical protein
VANVAAPVASGRVRPVHDAAESTVTPQHVEVLVVAVDQDLLLNKRPRGSLAGGVTQAAVCQPLKWCAIFIPTIPPGLRVIGYGVDRGQSLSELAQPGLHICRGQVRLPSERGRERAPHPGLGAILVHREELRGRHPAAADGRERGDLACHQALPQSSPGQRRSTTSLSPLGESTVTRSMSAVIPPGKGATAVTRARA